LDRRPIKEVTREDLLYWVSNPTSAEEIKSAGFELEYINTNYDYSDSLGTQYKIVNTDITIVLSNLDFNSTPRYGYEYATQDSFRIVAIIAPASLVCPDHIGESANVFTEDGIAYAPNASDIRGPGAYVYDSNRGLHSRINYLSFAIKSATEGSKDKMDTLYITGDTTVGLVAKNIIGSKQYEKVIEYHQKCYNYSLGG
jgi:hypothetical protein